jgi:hypothetical protein
MDADKPAVHDWRPAFLDYLYVALTNATALSPTDAMPLAMPLEITRSPG